MQIEELDRQLLEDRLVIAEAAMNMAINRYWSIKFKLEALEEDE